MSGREVALLKPNRGHALRMLLFWTPFALLMVYALIATRDGTVSLWVRVLGVLLLGSSIIYTFKYYKSVLGDHHPLVFARGDVVYHRVGGVDHPRRTVKLLECGPHHAMKIERAELYIENDGWGDDDSDTRFGIEIKLFNGSDYAQCQYDRSDVEHFWKWRFKRRFNAWQKSLQ